MKVPKSFFKWQKTVMVYINLLLPKTDKMLIPFLVFAIPNMTLNTICLILSEILQIYLEINNYKTFMLNMGFLSLHLIIISQLIAWFFIKKACFQIISIIERPTFNFKSFLIKNIVFVNKKYGEVNKYDQFRDNFKMVLKENIVCEFQDEIDKEMFNARFSSFLLATLFYCCIVINILSQYAFSLLLLEPYEKFNPKLNRTSIYRKLPFDTYFPFDISVSDGHFWWACFLQIYIEIIPPFIFAGKIF